MTQAFIGGRPGAAVRSVQVLGGDDVVGSWDWTAEASEGLDAADFVRGAAVNLGNWTDVSVGLGGDQALATLDTVLGPNADKAIRMIPTVGLDAQGILRATPAGDFVYASRFGLVQRTKFNAATTGHLMFAFVDANGVAGDVKNQRWYGAGPWYNSNTYENHELAAATGNSVGNHWDVNPTKSTPCTWFRATEVDGWLQRSGTTLEAWGSPPGGTPMLLESWVVSAGPGYVGWRIYMPGPDQHYGLVKAFARVSAIPGH